MKDQSQDPIFTAKGWAAVVVLGSVYAAIMFSLDPEWVAWAAPLGFGGALSAPGPTPACVQLWLPGRVMPTAYLFTVASLIVLALLAQATGESHSAWLRWIKERFQADGAAPLPGHAKPGSVSSH